MTFTLRQDQYEALIALAREGTKNDAGDVDLEKSRRLDEFLKLIEKENGVTRDAVWVQWQELDAPLPPGTVFPQKWPPELRHYIEYVTRKVAKADVDKAIETLANNPTSILVTKDPAALVGWTPLNDFFIN
jgi:hypothetical protein